MPVGLLASAILVVNNVRDLETDRRAGKRTLAVRLGRARHAKLYMAMVAGAFSRRRCRGLLGSMSAWLLLPWAAAPLALGVCGVVRTRTDGPALNGALARTGRCSSFSACSSPPGSSRAAGSARSGSCRYVARAR